jgi:hypothetical protein
MASMTRVQEDDDDFKCRVEQFDELLACGCSLWAVALVVGVAAHGTPSTHHAESYYFHSHLPHDGICKMGRDAQKMDAPDW